MNPAPRIGLYGPYGWGNLGDAAIQESMLHNVRERWPDAKFVGFSLNPENTEDIHRIESVPILRSWKPRRAAPSPSSAATSSSPAPTGMTTQPPAWKRGLRPLAELWRELRFARRAVAILREIDVLVISGGGQISDDWGGPTDHPYTMLKWVICARVAGTPVYVVSVGAGPFRNPRSASLFRWALRLVQYRSYRDDESQRFLARAAFTLKSHVYPDLAFSHPQRREARSSTSTGPLRVGVSPMGYFHPRPGVWPEQNEERYRRYLSTFAGLAARVRANDDTLVLFTSQIRNDLPALEDLGQALGVEVKGTTGLAELLDQITQCDVVVTSRLHGVILSYLHHRPVLSLSYDPKITAVMRQFGQLDYCLDIDDCTPEALQERFAVLTSRLDQERATIAAVTASHRARLSEQYDRLFGPRSGL